MTKFHCISSFLLLAFFSVNAVIAENVIYRSCQADELKNCEIHEVRVKPCAEGPENKACKLKKGHYASVEFDYTPNVSGDNLNVQAYWHQEDGIDLPFVGMNSTGCAFTSCPTQIGTKQLYSHKIKIAKTYPARQYDVKWVMKDDNQLICCFIFPIRISK